LPVGPLDYLLTMPNRQRSGKPQQLPRGRHRLSREDVERSQRERAMRGMVEVAAERGYAGTTVVQLVDRAEISSATFYQHFDDKEACFLAAYDELVRRLYARVEEAFEGSAGRPWAERVKDAVSVLASDIGSDPAAAKFAIIEVLAAGPRALARRDAGLRRFHGFIDAGRAESSLELPGLTSTAIVGGIYELLYSEILHGATAQLPGRVPEIVYWITQPFLGPERAAEERDRARDELLARA
jgi:AcrR family transcriptional regulator